MRLNLALRPGRLWAAAVALCAALAGAGHAAAQAPGGAADTAAGPARPRIGLVLSGGGARGLAHVGVLKVLQELRIPVDVVAGTSMGAIVGGLHASGMDASTLERELSQLDWAQVFASRVDRQRLSQRRKEEDFEISPVIELGLRDGELRTPQAAVSSRGLETLLRRYTLPVRAVQRFDDLPLPFRAVATDLENGQPVVLAEGDLATALRSSMSVPGVFAPTEVAGRLLGDGGLVNNLPVDVARALGADVVIAVNIGTPLAPRETLNSVLGISAQMINILTEQNVQRSLALLGPADVLVQPQLGRLSSGDFDRAADIIALGEAGARAVAPQLARLSLGSADYAAWQQRAERRLPSAPRIDQVRFEGFGVSRPQRWQGLLETQPGKTFDAAAAERDTRRLAASGDYTRADYQLEQGEAGTGLVFKLEEKPWGPNYFRIGLDLSTDFAGQSAFNLKISHNRHWLDEAGTEWRNRLQLGEVPSAFTELYHPLGFSLGNSSDWFVAASAGFEQRRLSLYADGGGAELAQFDRSSLRTGVDLGQPWGRLGEVRVGLQRLSLHTAPHLLGAAYQGERESETWHESGLRVRVVVDQLDFASFPTAGYRFEGEAAAGRRSGVAAQGFHRLDLRGLAVKSLGAHSFSLYGQVQLAEQNSSLLVGRYALGGFHLLSGYKAGQVSGNQLAFGRLTWYARLSSAPALTRGFFVGATLEAGNAWAQRGQMRLGDLRSGASAFLGADTAIGPLYLGLTHAPRGSSGVVLFIGRP